MDNHPVFLKYISDFLKDNGYLVKTANSGLLAINILKTFSPDYILVDLVMPNIDGTTLCRIIRNDSRFEKTPLFVISATAVEDTEHLKTLGATKHLETILEHISDGIFEVSQDGKIVFANLAAATCFSSTKETLLGVDFLSLFEAENMREVSALFEAKELQPKSAILKQEGRSFSIKAISIEPVGGSIILFNDVTAFEKTHIADQLRIEVQGLELSCVTSQDSIQISLSIGIGTLKPNAAVTIEQLLTAADKALYEAKNCGRNCISLYKADSKPFR